MLQIDLG